ncbi:AbrB family transcriptional regulator [uncultured Cohaesibacter sp.]|uniref:AbrB family transcriptional regulator n=1 Tax=uncultured Cohaesibacter sp. TaxID=1002546 RepID=UPI00292FEBD2|nr:AbrB family transcriptional regulator [uncultured Cohaesibacter sp.]
MVQHTPYQFNLTVPAILSFFKNAVALYLIAFCGGWLAHMVDFPAAWLTGSLLAVAITSLTRFKFRLPILLRDIGYAQLGLIMGSGFSPEMLHAISSWPVSILFLALTVVAIAASAYFVLRKVGGWDHPTALFAALPGALSYVMIIAEESKADMTRVAVAQTLRVFILITLLPLLLSPFTHGVTAGAAGARESLDLIHLALMSAAVLVVAPIAVYLRLPSGLMLSGMAIAGPLYLSGIYHAPLPVWFSVPAYLTIGIVIGSRFAAISIGSLISLSGISLLSLLTSAAVSALAAILCAEILGFPLGQVILAFAPGGFDTMVLLSFLINLNPAYVTGHHLVRFLGLVIFAPLVTARLTRSESSSKGL